MKHLTSPTVLLALICAGSAFAQAQRSPAAAQGQQRPAAAAPAPGGVSQPDNTTATYGDWTHRCQQGVGTRICEVVQTLQVQGQQGPVALVAVGRPIKTEPYKLVVQVAPNVTLGPNAGVRVALGEKDEGTLAAFSRCIPGGCFAEVAMSDDLLKRWRGYSEGGQLRFQDAANRPVTLPFSFRGFQAAADALAREP
ncbi:Invasion protein IalB, involved in pathogenesis [Bosea sp. OK403]|jgi:invasion protein IalB|uniref:invasion associated locus B family protein n=1 Tax=Bosea sp. OK403 TaxID=1855286 RepID=UPI0008E90FA6|nr:invasion associated locus B family protein [Bosea sp. OK403]SFJ06953.1 Invasion protein IalB, involved in pathogenesis [Bosea sp. OK403]